MKDLTIRQWQHEVHANAVAHGWYDSKSQSPTEILAKLMLVCSEVSEACEEVREGRVLVTYLETDGKPAGFAVELADAVIRIMDLAEWCGVDLQQAMAQKHEFNLTRPFMHGKKA